MTINNALEAATYGNLSRVAMNFYITNGNPAELDAAVCYARAAAYWANRELRGDVWVAPDAACVESAYGVASRLSSQINVF